MRNNGRQVDKIIVGLGLLLALWQPEVLAAEPPQPRISKPGQYQGYSEPLFDGRQRTSQYITVRDGTRIALDVFAYLEDIDAQGRSTYITEGCLRASYRALSQPPHVRLGLPYHSGLEKDTAQLTKEPVELVFDLLPTGKHFPAGHRIRIAVTGADKDSYQTPQHTPAPTITVLRDAQHPSCVILPVVD